MKWKVYVPLGRVVGGEYYFLFDDVPLVDLKKLVFSSKPGCHY